MWKGWEDLKAEMDNRYALLDADTTLEFDPIYAFLEEGNDFAIKLKVFWKKVKKGELRKWTLTPRYLVSI